MYIAVSCPAGSESKNMQTCEPCDKSFYKEIAGVGSCKPCAQGLTTSGTGATSEDQCNIGILACTLYMYIIPY